MPELPPNDVVASPRKFSHYVLVLGHPTGKDRIFLDRLGYRPRNETDARSLAAAYVAQARAQWAAGEVEFGERDEFGQRVTIVVEVGGLRLRSGWLLRPDGRLTLATPFSGFAP